jgi:histidyl-tRNA synthetase
MVTRYRKSKVPGKPIKLFEAIFSIVGGKNMLPEAESLKVLTEITDEFVHDGPYYLRVT